MSNTYFLAGGMGGLAGPSTSSSWLVLPPTGPGRSGCYEGYKTKLRNQNVTQRMYKLAPKTDCKYIQIIVQVRLKTCLNNKIYN